MNKKKIVIVGGVAGGASTAARLRRLNEENDIIMLERGNYVSFANCGLPYYIGDVIKEREALELMTPEKFLDRFNIDVRTNNEATKINRDKKQIEVLNHKDSSTYNLEYDKLVLSPGASPIKPNIKGMNEVDLFTLRTIPDSVNIKNHVEQNKVKSAVVVGGGFIGLELAENLKHRGTDVIVIEMLEQVMPSFDREIAQYIHQELLLNGVNLVLGDGVEAFEKRYDTNIAVTKSGRKIEADMIILAIGVKPDSTLAKDSGLDVGKKGHIIVDEHMMTRDPDIYAVGDAVQIKDFITGEPIAVPLAGPANKQGRIAAENIEGRNTSFKGVIGTSIVKVFGLDASSVGLNEKTLVHMDIDFDKVYVHPNNHAGYYPNSASLTFKLLFSKSDGKLLGAQIVGGAGVDKRIDVIASMIHQGGTVFDLEELELAYAPPYGSAKDPVNMAGFVASNYLRGDMPIVHWSEIDHLREKGAIVLDVRTKEEYAVGHIAGALNIPDMELRGRIDEVPKDKPVLVYCQVGFRGYLATRTLMQNGFKDVRNLTGGYKLYHMAHQPFDKPLEVYQDDRAKQKEDEVGRPLDDTIHKSMSQEVVELDCSGLQCPGPIMKISQKMKEIAPGSSIKVYATDPGFAADLPAWARSTGNNVESLAKEDGKFVAIVKKTEGETKTKQYSGGKLPDDKSIILFSDDMDKGLAAFILANSAVSMGRKVTIFATFWGLNLLKKDKKPKKVKKSFIQKLMASMMTKGPQKATLSKMNMMGIGSNMMKGIMKRNNVDSLREMVRKAIDNGVKVIACIMSMELMGIKEEELIDGIEFAGATAFLEASENSDTNLFIS